MEVKESQSGTIQINGSEGALLRDIMQINRSKRASRTYFRIKNNGSEGSSET